MSTPPVVVTVVEGADGAPEGGADAATAFAAGVATAEASQAAEEAAEALEVAEGAQATADAALSVAIDATLSESSCCAHCADQSMELQDLRDRLAALEDTALSEQTAEPAPERVEPAPAADAKPEEKKGRYGSRLWFGGS